MPVPLHAGTPVPIPDLLMRGRPWYSSFFLLFLLVLRVAFGWTWGAQGEGGAGGHPRALLVGAGFHGNHVGLEVISKVV